MAIWSKKSKTSNRAPNQDNGMIGGLSVDAHPASMYGERRNANAGGGQDIDMTVGDYMNGMPNIRLTSLFKGLVRQIIWIIPVFLFGVFAIHYFTKDIKRSYRAEGRLLVQIGPEYIYTPVGTPTNNSGGVSQTPDTIALNEVGILKNASIITYVTGIMTTPTDPENPRREEDLFDAAGYAKVREAEAFAERTGDEQPAKDARAELYASVANAYSVAPQPKSSLIDVAFEHENPEVAVATLTQFIEAYKDKRDALFIAGAVDTISERLRGTEKQLKNNERAIARFLERNDISDFNSEQDGLRSRSENLKSELNTLRGLMSETEGSLSTVEDQLRRTEQTINLYVDDRASQRIAQAELELKQLLAKYLPTSNPVRQKRTELEELKSLQSANNGRATGGRRVGPNPVYQNLVTRRNTLKASADSYREKEFTLQGQLNSAVNKVRRLTKVSPEYQNLLRERVTLSAALDTYNARAQEADINADKAQDNNENIKVISWPEFAIKGANTGKLIWAGGSLAWGLTLLMLALLRVFLDPRNFQAPGATRTTPRRARSTDFTPSDDGGIPEPIMPYEPRTPMPATGGGAIGSAAVNATRAYNSSAVTQTSQAPAAQYSEPHEPADYDPAVYQAATSYGDPQSYYAAPHTPLQASQVPQVSQDVLDMQNNPYLNMQKQAGTYGGTYDGAYGAGVNTQASNLPVLGSFSASKA